MLYQYTNILYCLTTVALMVIKGLGRGIFYDVTDIFHITTIEKFLARDKKDPKIYLNFQLGATFLAKKPCHVVLINVGQGLKKTVLNQNACFSIIFSKFCIISGFLYDKLPVTS